MYSAGAGSGSTFTLELELRGVEKDANPCQPTPCNLCEGNAVTGCTNCLCCFRGSVHRSAVIIPQCSKSHASARSSAHVMQPQIPQESDGIRSRCAVAPACLPSAVMANGDTAEPDECASASPRPYFYHPNSCYKYPSDARRRASSTPLSVLIVDDSDLSRKMMRLAVADEFDEVIEAKDGRQALETVQTRMGSNIGTDVVLMDWIMHVMDGLTATRELRKLGFEGFIAGVTGNALPVDVMTFKASGVDEVLTKPLNVNKLKRHLQEHGILTVW